MSVEFNEETRKLLDGKNFATVATLNRDGGPQTSVVWIARDGDAVLFSTTAGRQKARNLARDPRVSLTVFDTENPYRSVDIRGTVELIEDREKSLPRELSQKYLGENPCGRAGRGAPAHRPGDAAEGHRLRRLSGRSAGLPGRSWVERWMPPPPEAIVPIATGTTSRLGKCSWRMSRARSSALASPNSGMKTDPLAMQKLA